jgi:hypothetical protein
VQIDPSSGMEECFRGVGRPLEIPSMSPHTRGSLLTAAAQIVKVNIKSRLVTVEGPRGMC